jgi:hypothetical protein
MLCPLAISAQPLATAHSIRCRKVLSLVLLAMKKVCKISLIGESGHPNGFEVAFVRTLEYQGSKAVE